MQEMRFNPWVRKISWRRKWQPTPVLLPGKSYGQRAWCPTESDTTEHTCALKLKASDGGREITKAGIQGEHVYKGEVGAVPGREGRWRWDVWRWGISQDDTRMAGWSCQSHAAGGGHLGRSQLRAQMRTEGETSEPSFSFKCAQKRKNVHN